MLRLPTYRFRVRFASSCVDREEARPQLATVKERHDVSRFRVACKRCAILRVWFGGVSTVLALFPTAQAQTGPVSLLSTEVEPRDLGWTDLACDPLASRCDLADQEEEVYYATSTFFGLAPVNIKSTPETKGAYGNGPQISYGMCQRHGTGRGHRRRCRTERPRYSR